MNKNEFFNILHEGLSDFPQKELDDIIYDYEEHFSNALSDGKSEEEIITELGDPFSIVNQYRSGYLQRVSTFEEEKETKSEHTSDKNNAYENKQGYHSNNNNNNFDPSYDPYKAPTSSSVNNILKIAIVILAIIIIGPLGLGFFGGVFGVAIALIAVPVSLGFASFGLILAKFGITLFGFTAPAFLADFPISALILTSCGSLFASIALIILFVCFIKIIIRIIKKIISSFNKGV